MLPPFFPSNERNPTSERELAIPPARFVTAAVTSTTSLTVVQADHYLISPAFHGGMLDRRTLDWCIRLCKDNPPWRLSVQLHPLLGIP